MEKKKEKKIQYFSSLGLIREIMKMIVKDFSRMMYYEISLSSIQPADTEIQTSKEHEA